MHINFFVVVVVVSYRVTLINILTPLQRISFELRLIWEFVREKKWNNKSGIHGHLFGEKRHCKTDNGTG